MNKTHLKSIKNGRVFLFTQTLADRNDMVPCNAEGQIAEGHMGDATAIDAGVNRRVTKYLGSVKNGVLYRYTEFLAERDDMVSIDTKAQWEAMRKTGEAPEKAEGTIAPSLTREPKEAVPTDILATDTTPVGVPNHAEGPGTIVLPVIDGLGAREAKTLLSEWAEKKFKVKLDRRLALDEFVAECQLLVIQQMDDALTKTRIQASK